jgi:hypothetical protein
LHYNCEKIVDESLDDFGDIETLLLEHIDKEFENQLDEFVDLKLICE